MKRLLSAQRQLSPRVHPDYEGAFARVRLVGAWIGIAVKMVGLIALFSAVLDRLLQ